MSDAFAIVESSESFDFLFLTCYALDNCNDALIRIQSNPLLSGLTQLGYTVKRIHVPTPLQGNLLIPRAAHVIFHYHDDSAIQVVFRLKSMYRSKIICLGSDIYSCDRYIRLESFVDFYTAPTSLHESALKSMVWKSVFELPEGIDPISSPGNERITLQPENSGCLIWFGYSESFSKSLMYLLPRAFSESGFSSEKLILITKGNEALLPGSLTLPFNDQSFYRESARGSHALLSHFAYDCHFNSYIKSPNKLITALVRGLTPIFSATPNYLSIARQYGLEDLSFDSGPTLTKLVKQNLVDNIGANINLTAIATDLSNNFSPKAIADKFCRHI